MITTYIIIIVACVVMSAYFSATETAFSTMNKPRLKTMAEKGNKTASLALRLVEDYNKLITTILIGNNIVNTLMASIGTVLFTTVLVGNESLAAPVSTAVITVVVLIFGEITPKSLAKDFPESFALFSAPIINVIGIVLTPFNFLFGLWKKLISKIFKTKKEEPMSSEELIQIIDEVAEEGALDTEESELIKNAIEFSDLSAEDILTHRVDVEAMPVDTPNIKAAEIFAETGYSRLVVYEEDIDHVVGIMHQKDLYLGAGFNMRPIKDLITPPLFIHKSEKIKDILSLLQKNKSHIAVVVDDYGGTLGIVTMEDILEELVGDIWDEHDEIVEEFHEVSKTEYIVDCDVTFDDFCDEFEIRAESDSVSLGGFIMEQLGKVAEVGDSFNFRNLEFHIVEVDNLRVTKAKVIIHEMEESAEEHEERKTSDSDADSE